MENRVVITGLGIWSSIGTSLGEVTESLREGRSGIGLDPERRELGYISSLTGIVEQPKRFWRPTRSASSTAMTAARPR